MSIRSRSHRFSFWDPCGIGILPVIRNPRARKEQRKFFRTPFTDTTTITVSEALDSADNSGPARRYRPIVFAPSGVAAEHRTCARVGLRVASRGKNQDHLRLRRPAELHEGRADHGGGRELGTDRHPARPHRSALRRAHEPGVLRRAGHSQTGHQPRSRQRQPRGADGRGDETLRAGLRRASSGLGHRRRRRQQHDRLRLGGRQTRDQGCPRRGRAAQLRPAHAGRDQPTSHRRDQRSALGFRKERANEPQKRGRRG